MNALRNTLPFESQMRGLLATSLRFEGTAREEYAIPGISNLR
jgi:hypothetical protein